MREAVLILAAAAFGRAEIVDRIAITAGAKVITASEVDLRIRLTAFENGTQPSFDITSRRKAAELLIDQKLVQREMEIGHYPGSGDENRAARVSDYAVSFFNGDQAALARALLVRGLTESDLEEDLARQADLLTFLSLRFRPALRAGDANAQADADMEAWLREQRKRIRIEYLDKDLAP